MIKLFEFSEYTTFEIDPLKVTLSEDDINFIENDYLSDMRIESYLYNIATNEFNPFREMSNNEIVRELKKLKNESKNLRNYVIELHDLKEESKFEEVIKQLDEVNIKRQLLTNTFASRHDQRYIRLSLISNPEPFLRHYTWNTPDGFLYEPSYTQEEWVRKDYIKFIITTMIRLGSFPSYGYAASVEFTNSGADVFPWSNALQYDEQRKKKILHKMHELAHGKRASDIYKIIISAWLCDYFYKIPSFKEVEEEFHEHKLQKGNYSSFMPDDSIVDAANRKHPNGGSYILKSYKDFFKFAPLVEELKSSEFAQ